MAKTGRPYGWGTYSTEARTGNVRAKFRQINGVDIRNTFKTEGEAIQWLNNQYQLKLQRVSSPAGAGRKKVAEWVEEWLEVLAKTEAKGRGSTRRWGTIDGYRDKFAWFTRAYGGHRLVEITPQHIEALYDWLRLGEVPPNSLGVVAGTKLSARGTPLKVQGVVHLHHLLDPMFKRALRDHLIQENPMGGIEAPGIPKPERFQGTALDLKVWRQLLQVAGENHLGAVVVAAATLGARRGEVLGLTWSETFLDSLDKPPYLTISKTMQRVTGESELVAEDPKTSHSQRTVAIPRILVQALHAHRASGLTGTNYVFVRPTDSSKAMDTGYLWNYVWKPIRDQLNLDIRPHDLRYTLKTLLTAHTKLRSEFVDRYFGWSQGGMPSHYLQLRLKETEPVADEIDRLASGGLQESLGE
jgi:integrase